jgi:hypothetical protein
MDVEKEKANHKSPSSDGQSKNKQSKTSLNKTNVNLNLTPVQRLAASKSKIKNIVIGPTTLFMHHYMIAF